MRSHELARPTSPDVNSKVYSQVRQAVSMLFASSCAMNKIRLSPPVIIKYNTLFPLRTFTLLFFWHFSKLIPSSTNSFIEVFIYITTNYFFLSDQMLHHCFWHPLKGFMSLKTKNCHMLVKSFETKTGHDHTSNTATYCLHRSSI